LISVIIPTLNEGDHLGQALKLLAENAALHEVIVSDGGSRDDTLKIATDHGANAVASPQKGRAVQMNHGAGIATGETFLFLHADTRMRSSGLSEIEIALKNLTVVGGAFARAFDSESLFLKFTCSIARWRSQTFGWFFGDQAIFVRRTIFQELRGFRELPLCEDLDFSRRMGRAGKVVTITPAIVSSARRFEKRGPFVTTCHDCWLTCRYLASSRE